MSRGAPAAIAAASKPPIIQRHTARRPGNVRRSKKSFQLSGGRFRIGGGVVGQHEGIGVAGDGVLQRERLHHLVALHLLVVDDAEHAGVGEAHRDIAVDVAQVPVDLALVDHRLDLAFGRAGAVEQHPRAGLVGEGLGEGGGQVLDLTRAPGRDGELRRRRLGLARIGVDQAGSTGGTQEGSAG